MRRVASVENKVPKEKWPSHIRLKVFAWPKLHSDLTFKIKNLLKADDENFFTLKFQTNPFASDGKKMGDQLLVLKTSGVTVNYDNKVAIDTVNFFTVPNQLTELKNTFHEEYIQRVEQTRPGL